MVGGSGQLPAAAGTAPARYAANTDRGYHLLFVPPATVLGETFQCPVSAKGVLGEVEALSASPNEEGLPAGLGQLIAAARTGSEEVLGRILETCRAYLL